MKKILLLLSILLPSASFAQEGEDDYRPFAENGKTWETREGMIMENIYGNSIDGDTLINGETWKKVYNYHGFPEFNYSYYAAIRDTGKKVYVMAKGSNKPRLLYDFNLKEGQTVRCGVEGNAFGCLLETDEKPDTLLGFELASSLRVERIDTIETRGLKFRRFTLTFLDHFKYPLIDKQFENEQGILYDTDNVIWVEGIGSNVGPFFPWFPLQPQHAFGMTCSVDKTFIFGSSDFYMSSMQENFRPLVEQGKKWTYHHDTFENVYDYYYFLEGDTVIAGKNCLKMYSKNKGNQGEIRFEGALYEEDRKVYRFHQEIDVPEVLYDFDCQVGDTLPFQGAYLVIQAIESVEILGMSRKRYDFQAYVKVEDSDEIIVLGDGSWLEGIGSMKDFYNMISFDGNYNSLMACEMNGVTIYQSPTAIQSVRSYKQNANGAIYDLQGRRLKSKPSHRVYIQNGKKHIMR